jgi:hypothetical protein
MRKIVFIAAILFFISNIGFSQTFIFRENFEGASLPGLPGGFAETHAGGGNGWVTNAGRINWGTNDINAHSKYCMVDDGHYIQSWPG